MRVEIFEKEYQNELQRELNKWLSEYENIYEIIDIKYTGNGNRGPHSVTKYSAMVIYKN